MVVTLGVGTASGAIKVPSCPKRCPEAHVPTTFQMPLLRGPTSEVVLNLTELPMRTVGEETCTAACWQTGSELVTPEGMEKVLEEAPGSGLVTTSLTGAVTGVPRLTVATMWVES